MTGQQESAKQVVFGPFVYDLERKQLYRGGEPVDLQPKTVETLHALALRPGEVVDKADLMKSVWPDTVVEETGLARNISQLRKVLGEPPGAETYIQTVPRRGYRLAVAPPSIAVPNRRSRRVLAAGMAIGIVVLLVYWQFYLPSRWLPSHGGKADLAVMPLQGEPAGFSAALAAELAASAQMRVISPATIQRYRFLGIPDHWTARMLGADVMIEGDWPAAGSSLGGTARLTDVHSGRMIWSGRIHGIQAEPAVKSIASAVAEKLSQTR
jgi:DNA-binding winged helix-turn-helix (wHTH) protein/TolB-like protein